MQKDSFLSAAIKKHYASAWSSIATDVRLYNGPIYELPNSFSVLEFPPSVSRKMWTYATACMSQIDDSAPTELHIFYPKQSLIAVEILTSVAHYHRTKSAVALGDTVNFGKPWSGNSLCEYGLISLPYLDGMNLEFLKLGSRSTIRFLWLIPITKSEMAYKKNYGVDALEEKLEHSRFNYLDPNRSSVI